jgi:hypothetical protein
MEKQKEEQNREVKELERQLEEDVKDEKRWERSGVKCR